MKKCVFSGTFDPVTLGHADVVEKALGLFDEVHVLLAVNPSKNSLFTAEKRLEMLEAAFSKYNVQNMRVHVVSWERPLFEYCLRNGISHIVKGVRNTSDFEYEKTLALQTRHLCPSVETVLFYSESSFDHISSTYVKGLLHYGMDISDAVPEEAVDLILKSYSVK